MSASITQGIDRDFLEEMQRLDTRFMVAIHHGEIDVVMLAREVLMRRGLNGEGRWVGFVEARQIFGT
jgi:hypothetical protein